MKKYVVIPVYKEAENLKDLLPLLRDFNVIIVDDDSKDGTEKICSNFKNVKLIVRKNQKGLASAVVSGISSIKEKNAEIVVADADFEHDYSRIKDVFKLLEKNDFVECVKSGKRLWNRGIISTGAKNLLYLLVPEAKWLQDPMSGFFGFRLASVDFKKVKPIGYKIMLEIFINLKKESKKKHLVYNYGYRKHGKSKLKINIIMEFLQQVLRLNKYRVLKFAFVGFIGLLVNEFIAFLFHPYIPIYIDFLISAEFGVISNFLLNHFFTFRRRTKAITAFPRYNFVALIGISIDVVIATLLSFRIEYLIANFIGIIVAFAFNYVLSEKFAWVVHEKK